jgi:redox-sensitive bicupin YhaK (pirin superfamily)
VLKIYKSAVEPTLKLELFFFSEMKTHHYYIASLTIAIAALSALLVYTDNAPLDLNLRTNSIISSLSIFLSGLISTTTPETPPPPSSSSSNMSVARAIRKVFLAVEQSEGAGARVRRSIGTPHLRSANPFLMLDHFSVKPGAGFPDHPHRGQETITYLLEGAIDHEDFAGNSGTIGPGDLQFMTAGRGIMHAEMPRQNADGSANVGLQLWVDLPKHLKACEPRYRDLRAAEVPTARSADGSDSVVVKVISGRSLGVDSVKDLAYTPVWLLDVTVRPGGRLEQEVPKGWTAFAYVLEGRGVFGRGEAAREVGQFHNVVFEADEGDVVDAACAADAEAPLRFVLIAGTPLDQEVVQYGPFVLTSMPEVRQALVDFSNHQNGFERAKGWKSKIGASMA